MPTEPGRHAPSEHSSTSWLQAGPVYPEGQVQMALPFTGLVSQLEPSLQGLLMQASLRWHSRPGQGSLSAGPCPPHAPAGQRAAALGRPHLHPDVAGSSLPLPRDPQGRPAGPAADALPPSSPQKDPFQVVLEDLKATLV